MTQADLTLTHYSVLSRHSQWHVDNTFNQRRIPVPYKPWLTTKGSLTAALMGLSNGSFAVHVLNQQVTIPFAHEQTKLARPLSRAAMVREVELRIHGQAVVYARSIIPLALISNGRNGLANLGRTPLGHLLFRDGRIRISKRQFAHIEHNSTIIQARRTPYEYQGATILVSEFFLPSFNQYIG